MVLMVDADANSTPTPTPRKPMGKIEKGLIKKFTGIDPDELERTFDVSSRELAAAHEMLTQLVAPELHKKRHEEAIRMATGPGGDMAVNGECVFRMVQVIHALKHGAAETALILVTHRLR